MKTRRSRDQALRDAIAFALTRGIGGVAFREGIETHGSAAEAFLAKTKPEERAESWERADRLLEDAARVSAQVIVLGDDAYPQALHELPQPPTVLTALGDISLMSRPIVGIVGTRHSSASGDRIAHQMATKLVEAGAVVVSGMALGVDAAAHRGALDAGGGTIAVLGGGVDVPYPPTHATLHERIVGAGLAISEAPIGSRPTLGAFPKRNRIIAALAQTLFVIEAGERSGALITARIALDLGRNVGAVPGPIDSPRHVGTNRLLSDGAAFVGSVDDVLSIAKVESSRSRPLENLESPVEPDDDTSAILTAVRAGTTDVEDLARSTRLTPREFATALALLELRGELLVGAGGCVELPARNHG